MEKAITAFDLIHTLPDGSTVEIVVSKFSQGTHYWVRNKSKNRKEILHGGSLNNWNDFLGGLHLIEKYHKLARGALTKLIPEFFRS